MAFRSARSQYQKMARMEEKPEDERAHRILECPVCLELPAKTERILQCSNGHLICKSCHGKLTLCPVCREKLDKKNPMRNLTAEQFRENMDNNQPSTSRANLRPRRSSVASPVRVPATLPCRNRQNGCDIHFRTNGELVEHQRKCRYRQVFCPDLRCNRKITLANLGSHINDDHPSDDFTKLQRASVNFSLVIKPGNYRDETFWKPAIMQVNHHKFYRECRRTNDGQWYFWIYMEGSKEEASEYTATIKLFNSRKQDIVCFNCCEVLSLDVSPNDVRNHTVMTVQDPIIQSIEYGGKLSFFVEIVRK